MNRMQPMTVKCLRQMDSFQTNDKQFKNCKYETII